jgi:peptidoglycan/xylan/chitin deacetylase (PgdA/CDA1 family)
MNRRQFTADLGLFIAALGIGKATGLSGSASRPQVAITLDDFNVFDTPQMTGAMRNQMILDGLKTHHVKSAVFVNGKYVDNEKTLPLVRAWDERGHMIGNHSYSHFYYHNTEFDKFTSDILRNETLLKQFPRFRKFFRFPYLKEGKTAEQREKMRAFLKGQNYRNAHVTIDASDWYVDQRLRARLKTSPDADTVPYRDFYLNHVWERATYYEELGQKLLGRSIKHTLLLHHNVLNGLFLKDLLQMFKDKGWKLISAEEAYVDRVYLAEPKIAPAGESLIWALAKESGKFESHLRYPGEDGDYEKPKMDALGL